MEGRGLPFFGPSVEFSSVCFRNVFPLFKHKFNHNNYFLMQVPPIETKRILSYFNQFVSNSVQLLNKFAVICDTKLHDLNYRLQDVEATLAILEAKVCFF